MDEQAARTHVERVQLEQVLLNLAANARDAMPTGGHVTISASIVNLDGQEVRSLTSGDSGRYLAVSVRDTSVGVPEELRHRIFDPFFTTKAPDRGTGLGLAAVERFVRGAGGSITVQSEPGHGTVITLYLPKAEEDVGP
jgi:two-component system cell cycle sensor histidine kinase/response regulator CckA